MVNEARADALLARLVARHAGRVADLDARLAAAGMGAQRPPTWATLPAVPPRAKSELAALQAGHEDFGGLAPAGLVPSAIFWSPGGLIEPHNGAAVQRLVDLLRGAGFAAGDRVANGFSYHFTPGGQLVHDALVKLGASVLPIGPQQTTQAAEFLSAVAATGFVGTASHLQALARAFDALPAARARPPLRLALAGTEPFGDAIRHELGARLGLRCFDFYGTAESGVVATGCEADAGLHLHEDVLAEIVEPGTGRRSAQPEGELLLSADGDELPLLRFATGDWVRVEHGACRCGLATPRLRILGRVGDSARVRGMLLHASQLRGLMAAAGLAACRATLTRTDGRDHIELRYRADAADGARQAIDTTALAQVFRDHCRLRADVLVADDTLPPGDATLADLRVEAAEEVAR